MIARFHSYVYPLTGNLAQNAVSLYQPLQLDTDSYFALRGISIQINTGGPGLAVKYTDPLGRYIQQALIQVAAELGTEPLATPGACTTQWAPVCHQIWYPPGGVIDVDLANLATQAGNIGNIILVFFGTKYLTDNSKVFSPAFPPCFEARNYNYGTEQITLTATQELPNQFLPVNNADFVIQSLQTAYSLLAPNVAPVQLGIRLKDFTGKYYDNGYVPINMLFGQGEADRPGMPWPEIYITQDQGFFFDLKRNDAAAADCLIQLRFGGMRVYDRTPASARMRG